MRFSVALLGSQLLIAGTIFANPIPEIATDTAFAPALAGRNELGTSLAPNGGNIVDCIADEDSVNCNCGKLKRDAEVAAGVASDAFTKYLTARTLIRRDADAGEDEAHQGSAKLKRDAAAAAVEAASAWEEYARSLEN
ncbi:MAG: hypothetical protein OHK93_003546 [Ramalina farinacea]|uniref:Uncharacterized protein n=1 Tax=Ramalina farinacea TaxID=258253 RepID=A0AA43TY72_9LECA|nr:hypothetical protein [Ramalina farinacea]